MACTDRKYSEDYKDYIENKGAPLIEMRESGEAKILTQRDMPAIEDKE